MNKFQEVFKNIDPPKSAIFNRLIGILSEVPYKSEDFSRDIKRFLLDDSDSGASINFYPSDTKGGCRSECIAVATEKFGDGKTKKGFGFEGIIKEMCRHWWSCMKTTRNTMIVVRNWDQEAFESEYLDIIKNYESATQGRVYIVESSPGQLIPRYPQP